MKTKRYKTKKNSRRNLKTKPVKVEYGLGDIVQIQEWCSGAGRLGIVVEVPHTMWDASALKIVYLEDLDGGAEHPVPVLTSNIKKLETEVEN